MKQKFKGFTLVELVVVIVLFAMLLLMISGLFKPIATLFKSAKESFSTNTTTNGIVEYISESVRYAVGVQVYLDCPGFPTDVPDAWLTQKEIDAGGMSPVEFCMKRAKLDPTKPEDRARVQIIAIYNDDAHGDLWSVDNDPFIGRVYRQKGVSQSTLTLDSSAYQALGFGFYGPQDYKISLIGKAQDGTTDVLPNDGHLYVTVETLKHSDKTSDGAVSRGGTNYVNKQQTNAEIKVGTAATPGVNHYIVFVLPKTE